MDEKTLNELLECSVCLERLDSSSKVLPCQHTFCCRCLEEIVTSNSKNELRCPECRFLVENSKVSELPSNLLLVRLLEGLKTSGVTSEIKNKCDESLKPAKYQSLIKKPGQATPCAKALYNYEAREPGDLSFKKGDIVLLRKQVDENWYHGELAGLHGFFPATYVQVITPLPQQELPKCTALFDFVIDDENEKDCLTFQKDEVLTVIRRVDEHWLEGKLGEHIGIFPISFVDLNDAAKWLISEQAIESQTSTNIHASQPIQPNSSTIATTVPAATIVPPSTSTEQSPSSVTTNTESTGALSESSSTINTSSPASSIGILITTAESVQSHFSPSATATFLSNFPSCADTRPKRHSLTLVGHPHLSVCSNGHTSHRHSLELGSRRFIVPDQGVSRSGVTCTECVLTTGAVIESTRSKQLAVHSSGIYKAMFNYKPQKEDEVELVKGRYYLLSEKCQDGWFKGTCLAKGVVGVFPGNYVQLVRIAAASVQTGLSLTDSTSVDSTQVTTTSSTVCSEPRPNSIPLSRNHSFPKTSPYHMTAGVHTNHALNHPTVKVPSRTITNVTQALARASVGLPAQTHLSHSSSTKTSPSHSEASTSGESSVVDSSPVQGISDSSHICMNPGATTHSPKSSRRHNHHHHYKHSGSSRHSSIRMSLGAASGMDVVPVNGTCGGQVVGDMDHCQAGPSTQRSLWVVNGRGPPDSTVTDATQKIHSKEKHKDRRDKRSESLLKRLASAGIPLKGRKSRSPPPEVGTKKHHRHSNHQGSLYRSGSEGSIVEGAVAAENNSPSNHSHHRKPLEKLSKIKPLAREKYRCITPYPAQSEMELELRVGDTVYVHKKREDGWFKGTLYRTGKTGLFPCSFVEKM